MSDIPLKRCSRCGKDFPATTEFFIRDKHAVGGFRSECKPCRSETRPDGNKNVPEGYKQCSACKQTFLATVEFFVRDKRNGRDGLYSLCKTCNAKKVQAQRERHKNGKDIPKITYESDHVIIQSPKDDQDRCNSCGSAMGNILGDIDETTHERYGYLCSKCYRLVRDFDKDPIRLRKVSDYIERTRLSRV